MSHAATAENPEENDISHEGAAQGAAVGAEQAGIDPDLAAVIEAWPELPEAVRRTVVLMVRVGSGKHRR